jgi:hypothetical protein
VLHELNNIYAVAIVLLYSVEMINKLFYSILFYSNLPSPSPSPPAHKHRKPF